MKNLLTIVLVGSLLSGCAHFFQKPEPPIVIVTTNPHVYAPKVDPIKLSEVKWKIYNINELKTLVENSKTFKDQIVLFTLDEENFKLLNNNLNDIKRYIKQKNEAFILLDKAANAPADAAASVLIKDGKK